MQTSEGKQFKGDVGMDGYNLRQPHATSLPSLVFQQAYYQRRNVGVK